MLTFLDSVTLFFGKSFTGKTARMLHELRGESRVLFLDGKCAQLIELPGWKHFFPSPVLEGEGRPAWSLGPWYQYLSEHKKDNFRVMLHFRDSHKANMDVACRLALALKNCVLAVDELSLFLPVGLRLSTDAQAVIVSGTHDGVKFIGTAQRLSLVHPTAKGNASRMYFFRMTEENDLDAVRNYLPSNLYAQIDSLPDYTPVIWADEKAKPFVDCTLAGKLHNLPESRI